MLIEAISISSLVPVVTYYHKLLRLVLPVVAKTKNQCTILVFSIVTSSYTSTYTFIVSVKDLNILQISTED